MNKSTWTILGIAVLLLIVVIGTLTLSKQTVLTGNVIKTESQELGPIKIGVSLPLTGEGASLGEGGLTGVELAQKEINANGGVNGRKIELVIEDDQCTARGGVSSLTKLATVDQVTAIIGPLCSVAAGAGLPIAQENEVPVLVWGSAPHLTDGKDYIFRNYPSDSFQGRYTAEYMFKEGQRKVAVIYVQNDWGEGQREFFIKRFTELGGEIILEEGLAQDTKDIRGVIAKLSNKKPDAIFFPVYPNIAVSGLKQMKEMGIKAQIYSGDVMETPDVIRSGYADGVKYTLGKISNPEDFAEKVKQETGKTSEFATPLGYDSLYIFAEVIGKVGTDSGAIKEELQTYKKADGISFPLIDFDDNGDLKSAEFSVKLIEDGEARVIN